MIQCCCLDRATGKRCENRGTPESESNIFMCEGHLIELECCLHECAERDAKKHANN